MNGSDISLKSVNLNTVISLAGFLGTFVLIGIAWGTTTSEINDLQEYRDGHVAMHRDLSSDNAAYRAATSLQLTTLQSQITKLDQYEYRMAQLEKAHENVETRISRITESYSNQFADFRTQLSSISTQIALTNQTLQRIEARPPDSARSQ